MTRFEWWSQPYAPEGSVAGDGIVKQLGRPSLDPLTILVREAAQNSWDARADSGSVSFQLHLRRLGHAASAWRNRILPAPHLNDAAPLDVSLDEDTVVLIVSDRNTVGLGGPVRAGMRPSEGEKPDFVQFLRNVGEPRDHEHGGGTYGFGKGIFYRLSRAGTIVVDTLASGVGPNRRLMGAALGDSFYVGNQRYTGRHWWGVVDEDVPDPLTGDSAAAVSAELGLPGFASGPTGTDIVVVDPVFGSLDANADGPDRNIDEAAEFLASSILWHLWPKYVPDADGRFMRFAVTVNGRELPMPMPDEVDELAPFLEALSNVRNGRGARYARTVAPKDAGSFSLKVSAAEPHRHDVPHNAACPLVAPLHHVARMRTPELIVDYQVGPPHPDPRLAYAGVFRASPEADEAFAAAEPPTHDAWISKGLSGSTKGVVQRVQGFISGQIDEVLRGGHASRAGEGSGLGELSARLASLIPVTTSCIVGEGRRKESSGLDSESGGTAGASRTRRRNWKPRITDPPRVEIIDGAPRVVARVRIPAADVPRNVVAQVDVVVDGGGVETEPPANADRPEVIEWRRIHDGQVSTGDLLVLPAGEESDWWLHSTFVGDAVTRLTVRPGSRHGQ